LVRSTSATYTLWKTIAIFFVGAGQRFDLLSHARTPLPAAVVGRGVGHVASAKNGQVTLLGQASGIDSKRMMPMTLILVMVFNTLVALALGFLFGRIYQIRRDERRDGFALPPTARIPQP
jgi:hypothetical protein